MKNTFWTIIGSSYYRIKDGELLQAPINIDNSVDTEHELKAQVVSPDVIKQINSNFGSNF